MQLIIQTKPGATVAAVAANLLSYTQCIHDSFNTIQKILHAEEKILISLI
jgi:hypothetical protein